MSGSFPKFQSQSLDSQGLHSRALELAHTYKKTESELIDVLQKIEAQKIYLKLKYTSLFDYCVKALGLAEGTAYNFITVARKAVEVPKLKEAISQGEITVSKAKKMAAVINKDNQDHWIELAKTLPQKSLEREVAKVAPRAAVPDRESYVQEDLVALSFGVKEEIYEKLKRVRDLESQRTSRAVNLEETLEVMLNLYLSKNDPLEKAKRADERSQLQKVVKPQAEQVGSGEQFLRTVFIEGASKSEIAFETKSKSEVAFETKSKSERAYENELSLSRNTLDGKNTSESKNTLKSRNPIPFQRTKINAARRHQVILRDKGKCTVEGCENRRWLDVHHIIPVAHGGTNELNNLRTLCSKHHRMLHF